MGGILHLAQMGLFLATTIETGMQRPSKRHLLKHSFHWKCLLLTLLISSCIGVIGWCQLTALWNQDKNEHPVRGLFVTSERSPCDRGYHFIPIAFSIMLYVVYLMECWHCKVRVQLTKKQTDVSEIYNYLEQLRNALPIVWWRAVCYHYIRRTRQVTRYRNGDAVTSSQVYYERVNTHSSGAVFLYHDCGVKDISKKLVGLEENSMTKIKFAKGFVFSNLQAANEFEEQRNRFFHENEQRDDYMEVREGLDLMNVTFKDHLVTFTSSKSRPWYTSHLTFWLLSLILLSWPLRILIECKTAYVHYQVTKLFGTNYLSPSNENYTGPLTRVNTLDSADMRAAEDRNYYIVPSYSEAMLMDPVACSSTVHQDRDGNIHIQSRRSNTDETDPERAYPSVFTDEGSPLLTANGLTNAVPHRSRSLSLARFRSPSSGRMRPPSVSPMRRPGKERKPRSVSFGNLVQPQGRGQYRTFNPGTVPEDDEEEPPPPYEVALQMCRPLLSKIRRSLTSESNKVADSDTEQPSTSRGWK